MNTVTEPKAKGEKLETLARVIRADTACCGMMAWETPRLTFRLPDGREVIWHSEAAAAACGQLAEGSEVALNAFLYGRNLRRVQVARGCSVFGMGGI